MNFRLDDLYIDTSRQTVARNGDALDVKGLSYQLLEYLLRQGRRVVTYDELIEAVWAPAIVNEETVTQRVRLLRAALQDDGRKPRYVRSVRGQGYQLCFEPRRIESPLVVGESRKRRAVLGSLAASVLLGGVVVYSMSNPAYMAPAAKAGDGTARLLERADYYAGIGQAENNERAIDLYRQVLAVQPEHVQAQLGLSFALSASTCQFNGTPRAAGKAGEMAAVVLAKTPSNARAYAALAYSYDCRGLIDKAIASYERAMALDPEGRRDSAASAAHLYAVKGQLADALRLNLHALPYRETLRFVGLQLANVLDLLGFHVAAEQRYAEEFALYPDNVFANAAYPSYLFAQGRLSEAKAVLQEALARPSRPELLLLAGEIHLIEGEREAARQRFAEAAALREHMGFPGTLAKLYDATPPDAVWLMDRTRQVQAAIDGGDRWSSNWLELALLWWQRGDEPAAMRALHDAVDNGYRDDAYLRMSPLFAALRDRPEFAMILDRIASEVARERETVLAAEWLPASLLSARR